MSNEDDEVYLLFLEESQEHLVDIESDLLELEEQQDNPDEELLNKVFRAIHTVKGGSGFFGLQKIKDLSHSMENMLGLVRSGDIPITSELISILLDGGDSLRRMVFTPDVMDEIDIAPHIAAIDGYINGDKTEVVSGTSTSVDETVTKEVVADENPVVNAILSDVDGEDLLDIGEFNGRPLFSVSKEALYNAQIVDGGGPFVYLIEYDLYKDIESKGLKPQDLIDNFNQLTVLIDSFTDFTKIGTFDIDSGNESLPFYILCATVMDPDIMSELAGLPVDRLQVIYDKKIDYKKSSVEASVDTVAPNPVVAPSPVVKDTADVVAPDTVVAPSPVVAPAPIVKTSPATPKKSNPSKPKTAKKETTSSVRIAVNQLEILMNLAGELVLTRNELLQRVGLVDNRLINDAAQRVDSITSELQEAIMTTRMQSVGVVFNKFKRIVRDLSSNLGKEIELVIEGEDVELDRTIVEAIGDPLTHMVRNSIDHGIEMPDVRMANGKPKVGTLNLKAMHIAGQVVISITDDGAGIDPDIIGKIAVDKGVVSPEELENLSKKDIIKLIFKPGFSTAEEVTDISGRGVGMDVVLSTFNKVGGIVDINSVVGKGSEITIKLPLTLAIIPSLLLTVGKERFAIPQVNLVELVRIKAEGVKHRVEKMGDASVLRLRGELLPLVHLAPLLGMEKVFVDSKTGEHKIDNREMIADRRSPELGDGRNSRDSGRRKSHKSALNIAIVNSGDVSYGIVIDSLLDSEEIVVKPLGIHLKSVPFYAGATILGDGHVAMILDITSIKEHSIVKSASEKINRITETNSSKSFKDVQSYLLIKNGGDQQYAIPMVLVSRIERISSQDIKTVGAKLSMLYRGDTIVILQLSDISNTDKIPDTEKCSVVIFNINGKEIGLLTSEVDDIITFDGDIDGASYIFPGVMGTFIYNREIIMLIDLFTIASTQLPELISQDSDHVGTILVVDDSRFFRNQLVSFLNELGYVTFEAEDGKQGLEVLAKYLEEIDMVYTDIEMPVMNGLEFAKSIKSDSALKHLPVVALSSLTSDEAIKLGSDAGLDDYLVKMNKEQIIDSCNKFMVEK